MNSKSIRFRLTVWYSLALAAGLALFASAIWLSMRHSLVSDLDNTLAETAANTETFLRQELADRNVTLKEELDEYAHALPPGTHLEIVDRSGSLVFVSGAKIPRALIAHLSAGLHALRAPNTGYHVLIRYALIHGGEWRIVVSASLDNIENLLRRLRWLLIAFIPAIIAIAGLGGAWLSRRALKPVDAMTAVARAIGINNLSERLAIPQTGDELERLAETWNAMLARLEDAFKRLSRFTADASHELRTPLAVIRTTAELASRRSRSAESYRDALAQIAVESERTTRMVEDLLFLARCDAEHVEMPMIALDLAATVEELCHQMQPVAASKAITLTADIPKASAFVNGNEIALRRLVLALLDNAIRYSRIDGEVKVRVRDENDSVRLEVEDSGPGIPETELPHIFDRFYRSPEARASGNGSGLGLSLAASIAQRHHARINVTSRPGRGSVFSVIFQAVSKPARTIEITREQGVSST